jgi:NAD(P)-dependent dehydrogenase (short-subunit alcohol dehydrogenase family)
VSATLAGRVVVVTGSTRGIGRAIAAACAREGAAVVVNGRGVEAVDAALSGLRATGAEASGMAGDVSSPQDVRALFDHALAEHGRIDVWFNNAGLPGGFRPADDMTPEELLEIVDVNIGGVLLCCRLVVPHMRKHCGLIVNMCGRGSRGETAAFGAPYAATKAALASLTRSIAAENSDASNLRIVGMIPGMVPTAFYEDMATSPRCADKLDNVYVALEAFGASLDEVGTFGARLAAAGLDLKTGSIHSIITPARSLRGVLKLVRARLSGRMKPM